MCSSDIFLAVLAVFFPPIAVWVKVGLCTADSVINLALCCLGFLPGLIHAWYIIFKNPEPDYDAISYEPIPGGGSQRRDLENGNVTYYYVSRQSAQDQPRSQRGYGTVQGQQAPAKNSNAQGNQDSGNGSSSANPPPTYAEAVRGDNKVQSQE
ncbi:unnamed protein product [Penicillium salamii]|uniref:Stress response RCI peptide n=1 Tax=Penicillium salamii TaxID=1612424 RepID=A0A9W4JC03_9EURO|nr:unnamed protein product [Penicillium salamii]CAG8093955.1 unnamed protein product [Penicillium salamii]CAG8097447.1 unnamed protein product [Penicillium salamii]CAG8139557.1 unnamed protein product [Penicillium salamii]CAG8193107.1 unnamed protein product [Penicillium salamii]